MVAEWAKALALFKDSWFHRSQVRIQLGTRNSHCKCVYNRNAHALPSGIGVNRSLLYYTHKCLTLLFLCWSS